MSHTDEIYTELKNGLWTGNLDYEGLRLKYEKNKSSFYKALQLVLADASAEMMKLSSELKALRDKGDEEKAKLKSLTDQQEKAADAAKARQQEIETLEREEQAIKARIQGLSAELNAGVGLLN